MKHEECHAMGPLNFGERHFYAPTCPGCNLEFFFEGGEAMAWAFVLADLHTDGGIRDIPFDEWRFYWAMYCDLRDAASEWVANRQDD